LRELTNGCCLLYPLFSFPEKVRGKKIERGEGSHPLLPFFRVLSRDFTVTPFPLPFIERSRDFTVTPFPLLFIVLSRDFTVTPSPLLFIERSRDSVFIGFQPNGT